MGVRNNKHKCYCCGKEFDYHFNTPFRGIGTAVEKGQGADTVIATGTTQGSQGTITHYEVSVKCPHCGIMNKIIL